MELRSVGVVGCGLMGSGITQVAALAGYGVVVREAEGRFLERGMNRIEKSLTGAVEKGKITETDKGAALDRITATLAMDDLAGCDLIVEAIPEEPRLKTETFGLLDDLCSPRAIFASNTSAISITEMAGSTSRPDKFLGLHFFNPVPVMKLVEIVKGIATSVETIETCAEWVRSLGKHPIVAKDSPGFVVNLLLIPYLLDAVRALERGVASREDIDEGMRLGCGYPMGPLALMDFIGLDTTYYIANVLFDEFKDARYAPPAILKRMVTAGQHGRKTGKGFYDYTK